MPVLSSGTFRLVVKQFNSLTGPWQTWRGNFGGPGGGHWTGLTVTGTTDADVVQATDWTAASSSANSRAIGAGAMGIDDGPYDFQAIFDDDLIYLNADILPTARIDLPSGFTPTSATVNANVKSLVAAPLANVYLHFLSTRESAPLGPTGGISFAWALPPAVPSILNLLGDGAGLRIEFLEDPLPGSLMVDFFHIFGTYDVVAYWWTLPEVSACGDRQTPHLQFSSEAPSLPSGQVWERFSEDPDLAPTPVITAVTPNHGLESGGTEVTITGSGFGDEADVTFGGVPANDILVVSEHEITCIAPPGSGAVAVVVTNIDGVSSATSPLPDSEVFTYEARVIEIVSVSPSVGPPAGGTAVNLFGRGFLGFATGTSSVDFDGTPATSVVVVSDDRITCVTPAHALGAVDVTVTNSDGDTDTLEDGFTYQSEAPSVNLSYRTPGGAVASRVRLESPPPKISQVLGQPWTADFSTALEPAGEMGVAFYAFGQLLFDGTVTKKKGRSEGEQKLVVWDTQATNFVHRLAKQYPTGSWTEESATSVILQIMGVYGGGFSTAGVESGLSPITLLLDGSKDLWSVITDICNRCGAKAFLASTTLHVFTEDSGFDPPNDVTDDNPDLCYPEQGQAVTVEYDYSQIRNIVKVYGAAGVSAQWQDADSIRDYGPSYFPIFDNTLETFSECLERARVEVEGSSQPTPVIAYASRDLKTMAGKTVVVSVSAPPIDGEFIIRTCTIDQLEVIESGKRPRFSVTATPAETPMRRASGLVGILQQAMDATAAMQKAPKLDGDIVSEPGGRTTIPPESVPATALAGCIPGEKLLPTGVTPGTYGSDAYLPIFEVNAAGQVVVAGNDTVPVGKTDGSQAWTADQNFGGNQITNLGAPGAGGDATNKTYVDAEDATFIKKDGSRAFTADQSLGTHKLTNVVDPASPQDAATKAYVDALSAGLNFKASARLATTANHSLSGLANIDGVTPVAGDRILVKAQTTGQDNGIYVAAAGAWARSADADTSAEVTAGMLVYVNEGSTLADTAWVLSTNNPIVLGTTVLTFVQFGAGSAPHNLLSATHPDTTPASPSVGDLVVGGAGPSWKRKAVSGVDGSFLMEDSAEADGLRWADMSPASALAYRATAQNITGSTETAISFSNTLFDTDSFWAGGAPTRLTVPAGLGGKYIALGQVKWNLTGTGPGYFRIYQNGTLRAESVFSMTSTDTACQVSAELDLAVGDYIELKVYHNSSTTPEPTVGGSAATFLSLTMAAGVAVGGSAAPAGALVLLESHVASASASLDFTTRNAAGQSGATFQSDFDEYLIEFVNVRCATNDVELRQTYSVNGGSSYDTSGIYDITFHYISTTGATAVGQATAQGFNSIGANLSNGTTGGICGSLRVYSPLDTAVHKASHGLINFLHSGVGRINFTRSYLYKNTAAVNAMRFAMSSGNIASGTIRVYGIAK